MPLIKNEQTVKQPSDFLKLEKENIIVLKSNVYTIQTHYLNNLKKSVLCMQEDCVFCKLGEKKRFEYNYYAKVNEEEGIIRIPAGVFFNMNQIEKVTKKDKRNYSWLVIKEGEGKDTRYTVSKDEAVTTDPTTIEVNNDKLERVLEAYETTLTNRYGELHDEYTEIAKRNAPSSPERAAVRKASPQVEEKPEDDIEVHPDDIPF